MRATGSEIGRYRVEELLGRGGMGEVYRAFDTVLRRDVALKVLRADLPDAAARLLREARAAAAASHPGAVSIFDVGEAEGTSYIAMELVVGRPLRAYVGKDVPLEKKLRWLADVARVLAAAHEKGFVHRDVKPDNVMIGPNDAVKVLDFGIAKRTGHREAPNAGGDDAAPLSYQTQEGKVTGTPRYMAPEQLRGEAPDGRTDQYAWGAMAYELVAGVHPHAGSGPPEMLNHLDPAVPFEVAAAVARALAPVPELRFPTMSEAAVVLERATQPDRSEESHRPSPRTSTTKALVDGTTTRVLARLRDPLGPSWFRSQLPALLLVAVVVGGAIMMFGTMALERSWRPLAYAGFLTFVVALVAVYLRPLVSLGRRELAAEITCEPGRLTVRHASRLNQTLRGVVGASLVEEEQGTSLLLTRRPGEPSVVLRVRDASEARAMMAALGLEGSLTGEVRFSLGRGPVQVLGIVLGLMWRVVWFCVLFFPRSFGVSPSVLVLVGATISLAAIVVHFVVPSSGPYLAATAEGVTLRGLRGPPTFVARDDIVSIAAEGSTLRLHVRGRPELTVDASPGLLSTSGLSAAEAATLARHVGALASVTRTDAGAIVATDVVEVGDRTVRDGDPRTV